MLTRADAARLQLVCRPFAHECALGRPSCKGRDKLQVLARQAWAGMGRHGQAWAGIGRHRQARAALEDEPGCCGGGDDGTISFWHCRLHTYIELAEK
jgi:hypothetical protein